MQLCGFKGFGASEMVFLISQLVKSNRKHLFLVDTLALGLGGPSNQPEVLTATITQVLNDSLENVSRSYVSKGDMQKIEKIQESSFLKFKSQGNHFSLLQHETEKLQNDIEKMHSKLRSEVSDQGYDSGSPKKTRGLLDGMKTRGLIDGMGTVGLAETNGHNGSIEDH
ncbi:hypothetical protein UlMin_023668 [Ulmus minor]